MNYLGNTSHLATCKNLGEGRVSCDPRCFHFRIEPMDYAERPAPNRAARRMAARAARRASPR